MKLEILKMDLFQYLKLHEEYASAQCISADFAMGAGIALQFNLRFDTRALLTDAYRESDGNFVRFWGSGEKGYCVFEPTNRVFCLVTKRDHWGKPTYDTLRRAIVDMKKDMEKRKITKVAMPMIGCGLDRLKWPKVEKVLKEVFDGTDVEVAVCAP